MYDFIWNIRQEGKIAEATADAAQARDEVSRYKERIAALEFSQQRHALACQALWELVRGRTGLTEAELLAKMTEIDLRDGAQDGRMTPKPVPCPQCGRMGNTKNLRCVYCGAAVTNRPHVFQS